MRGTNQAVERNRELQMEEINQVVGRNQELQMEETNQAVKKNRRHQMTETGQMAATGMRNLRILTAGLPAPGYLMERDGATGMGMEPGSVAGQWKREAKMRERILPGPI